MRHFSDIGAAVIGSGFIGTVHIEALRRLGVQVRGVLGSDPERGAAGGRAHRRARAPTPRSRRCSTTPRSRSSTSPRPTSSTTRRSRPSCAAGRHVICEKPLAVTSEESAELVRLAAASDRITAVNFNIRFYPLNQHAHQMVARRCARARSHLVTGHYFQDWLLLDTDWNWRLEPEKGGSLRAVGDIGSHWIDLTNFITGQRVASVMADLATFVKVRQQPTGPVETFSQERSERDGRHAHEHRGCRAHPAALRRRRARLGRHQPGQRGPQELAAVGGRRLDSARPGGTPRRPITSTSAIAAGPTRSCSAAPSS